MFETSLDLILFKDLDRLGDAFPSLLGPALCFVQEPQIKISLGQNAFSSNFFCNLDCFFEVLFGLVPAEGTFLSTNPIFLTMVLRVTGTDLFTICR